MMATSIASLPNELNTKSDEITLEVSDKDNSNIVQPQQNYKASSEPMQQQQMQQQPMKQPQQN